MDSDKAQVKNHTGKSCKCNEQKKNYFDQNVKL